MASIQSFRDLEVYQFARREAHRIFVLSRKFPREERYSLTDQIRRCSRAVCSMIAEAWGRRRYEAAFTNKLNEAVAEAMEHLVAVTRSPEGSRIRALTGTDRDQMVEDEIEAGLLT